MNHETNIRINEGQIMDVIELIKGLETAQQNMEDSVSLAREVGYLCAINDVMRLLLETKHIDAADTVRAFVVLRDQAKKESN